MNQLELKQTVSVFTRCAEGMSIPFSFRSSIDDTKGRVVEEGNIFLNNISEDNVKMTTNDSETLLEITGIQVHIPEISFLLWEEASPTIQTAGFVEVATTTAFLTVKFWFGTKDDVSGMHLMKSQAVFDRWDAKIAQHSQRDRLYCKHSALTTGKIKSDIETVVAQEFTKKFSANPNSQEGKLDQARTVSSILLDAVQLHA